MHLLAKWIVNFTLQNYLIILLSGKHFSHHRKKLNSKFGVQLLFCFFVFAKKLAYESN